jgi:DNA-binding NtrC family response regulator
MARILIIDDNADLRAVLKEAIEADGHEVYLASEGAQALSLQSVRPVDVVLTDLFMPGEDGLETIAKFRRDYPQVSIIAMSGASQHASAMLSLAKQLGAVGILEKPFDLKRLLAAIHDVLAERESE